MILKILNSIKKGWIPEYKFCEGRKWRFDFANPDYMIAVEIEGGIWIKGRHNRASGYIKDMEKYNKAVLLGWKVLRYSPQQTPAMMDEVKEIFQKIKEGKICPESSQ